MNVRALSFLLLLTLGVSAPQAVGATWQEHAASPKSRFIATSTLVATTPVVLALREACVTAYKQTHTEKKKFEYTKKLLTAMYKQCATVELWKRHATKLADVAKCFSARKAKESRKAWALRIKQQIVSYAKTNPTLTAVLTIWLANIVGTTVHEGYKTARTGVTAVNDWIASLSAPKPSSKPNSKPKPTPKKPKSTAKPVVTEGDTEVDPAEEARKTHVEARRKLREENPTLLEGLTSNEAVQALDPIKIHLALDLLDDPETTKPANAHALLSWLNAQKNRLEKHGAQKGQNIIRGFLARKRAKKQKAAQTAQPTATATPTGTAPRGACTAALQTWDTPEFRAQAKASLKETLKKIKEHQPTAHAALLWQFGVNPLNPATTLVALPLHALLAVNPDDDATLDTIISGAFTAAKTTVTVVDVASQVVVDGTALAKKGWDVTPTDVKIVAGTAAGMYLTSGLGIIEPVVGEFTRETVAEAVRTATTATLATVTEATTANATALVTSFGETLASTISPAVQYGVLSYVPYAIAGVGTVYVAVRHKDDIIAGAKKVKAGVVVGGQLIASGARGCGRGTVACGSRTKRGAGKAWEALRRHLTRENAKKAGVAVASGTASATWWGTKKLTSGAWWVIKKDADFLATNLGLKRFAAFMLSGKNKRAERLKKHQ